MAPAVSEGWAWLPRDILDLILDKVDFHGFIRFSSVCKPWRSTALIATNSLRHGQQHQLKLHLLKTCRNCLPMLMTPTNDDDCDNEPSLYSVTDGRIYRFQLPMPFTRRFSGSSKGWLFTVDESMTITLIHPFLNKAIVLPKFQLPTCEMWWSQIDHGTDYEYFIRKVILLSDQDRENYEVLLIYNGMERLACLKPEAWEAITLEGAVRTSVFSDIISYKGQAYAVNLWGTLVRVDVTTSTCTIVVKPMASEPAETTYLVESQDGDLLLIRRYLYWPDEVDGLHLTKTKRFEVHKLLYSHRNPRWVKIKSIGEQALFLGDNYSLSISTRDFPNCKPNCIYYVDHYFDVNGRYIPRGFNDDSGIYNIEDRSITRHYTPDPSVRPSLPSIWVVPKFNT